MIRGLRVLVSVALVNFALSLALAMPAAVRAPHGAVVLLEASHGFQPGLARRCSARRRVEHSRSMPAVIPVSPLTPPQLLAFGLAQRADATPYAPAAPPDHPPA